MNSSNNNVNTPRIIGETTLERLIQRRQHRRHQKMRIYQRNAQSINNQESLDRIANLPRQEIINKEFELLFYV
ncbi:8854_t:CDS:2 [Funneliformis geosporum]|nr:8854_t:CDS:2 [Funneliformis geosporum]